MDPDCNARMLRLVSELQKVREELNQPDTDPHTGMAGPKLPLETTQTLKREVDELRLFLWAYLDAWTGNMSVQEKLQQIRIESALDMLRLLDRDFRASKVPPSLTTERFYQQIVAMADFARGAAA